MAENKTMNQIEYTETNGTSYHTATPRAVVDALETARANHSRVRLFLGDTSTGRDWCEENDVTGTLGRSMGPIKVPILLHNSRSISGGSLSDNCIVRLLVNGREVYRAANYVAPVLRVREIAGDEMCGNVNLRAKGYTHAVDRPGADGWENQANFKSARAAENYRAFMMGERASK